MQQKRKYKRFYFNGKVALKTGNGSIRTFPAYLDDISLGGFRVRSQEEMEVNRDVGVTVMAPLLDRPLLEGRGRIRHVNPVTLYGTDFFAMGVQFTHINKKNLRKVIDKTFGWSKKPFLSQQFKRELSFVLKLLPIAIPIVWSLINVTENYSDYSITERKYTEEFMKAIIYFLYHS